jgi:hypothetical protein
MHWKEMVDKLELFKTRANNVETVDDLFILLEWLEQQFPPPTASSASELRGQRVRLRDQAPLRRNCLEKAIRLYHVDKNATRGD